MKKVDNIETHVSKFSKDKLITPAVFAGVTAIGVAGCYTGLLPELLDSRHVVSPPVLDNAVEGMVTINDGLRSTAPFIALGMAGMLTSQAVKARFNSKERMLNTLSNAEYSGVDDIVDSHDKTSRFSSVRKMIGGAAIISATLIMSTSGLEKEISNGPNRPVGALVSLLSDNDPSPLILLEESKLDEPSTISLMDSSIVSQKKMSAFIKEMSDSQASVAPFDKDFMKANGNSAMEFSIPDEIFEQASGVQLDQAYAAVPVIVDKGLGVHIGDSVAINDTLTNVVGVESGIAQQNRNIVILSDTDMKEKLRENTNDSYFGAVISGASLEDMSELMNRPEFDGLSVITREQFLENNKDFWSTNGTPIILILMGTIAILTGSTIAGQRRSALQRNAREIGMLNASGVGMKDIASIERRRAVRNSLYATAVAIPFGVGLNAAFNATVPGLSSAVDARGITVAAAVTGASSLIASGRSMKKFTKQLNLSQAVKG